MRLRFSLVLCVLASCTTKAGISPDAGVQSSASVGDSSRSGPAATAGGPLACYVAVQFICDEYPDPTPAQENDVPATCSSRGGILTRPPACPTAAFIGKCTIGSGKGINVQRYYVGTDPAYAQAFCTTFKGVWSTTF